MLADEIAEGRFSVPAGSHPDFLEEVRVFSGITRRIASEATVIVADNVWEYSWSRGKLSLSEIPCAAPPFSDMVIEAHSSTTNSRWALVVNGCEPNTESWTAIKAAHPELFRMCPEPRWLMGGTVVVRLEGLTALCGRFQGVLDDDGRPSEFSFSEFLDPPQKDPWSGVMPYIQRCCGVGLLAISFMHCKNVVQRVVAPPPKLSKRHKERHGRPLFSYRVLEIEPMKQVLRTEGRSEEVGLARALHICRGHFKDYRERGLFGRNKGLYWWDHHVRGQVTAGVAAKDYKVKDPAEGAGGAPDGEGAVPEGKTDKR